MGTRRRVIVDTDVLVNVLRGAGKTVAFVARLEDEGFRLATTVINAFELYYGAYKSKKVQRNLAVVRELLSRMVVLKINERSAEKAGQIYAELEA
ncbi:MAG: type II toxin-antitoxin system VapC family toxin, partial [Thermofilaceae archaeon]